MAQNKEYRAETYFHSESIYSYNYALVESECMANFLNSFNIFLNSRAAEGWTVKEIKTPKIRLYDSSSAAANTIEYNGSIFVLFERTDLAAAIYG